VVYWVIKWCAVRMRQEMCMVMEFGCGWRIEIPGLQIQGPHHSSYDMLEICTID